MDFYEEISKLLLTKKIKSKKQLHKEKIKLCKKYRLNVIPPNSNILSHISKNSKNFDFAKSLLLKKPMRTLSGVAVVAVMTSPELCPHGKCIPCPGGPEKNTPQSYTGFEPAAMRGSLNNFDPYLQTKTRIDQLKAVGHPVDKIDFIIMGGTFTSRLPEYQNWFVKRCYDALNQKDSLSLEEAKKINESASSRCIGLTVETRPDWFRLQHADISLFLGATRVELGVQSVYDEVLNNIQRGHTVSDTIFATRIAKECGLKVCYHLMPGLPGSNEKMDIGAFKTVFQNEYFKPDMIKIYPTLIIEGTKLCEMWKSGEYDALDTKKASRIIAKVKEYVPEWVRIQRIQRDVPAGKIKSGVKKSNLRQIVEKEMTNHAKSCRCIRCRELGHKILKENVDIKNLDIELNLNYYGASFSEEIFISLEDKKKDLLVGYLRLRDINYSHRFELDKSPCMVIRELKILGKEVSIGKKSKEAIQHRGYGKELVKEAEKICLEEFDKKKISVLSGVGVKQYYRKIGFVDEGIYLSKKLK